MCHSDHCFIPADGPHFPLSHEHFEKWGAAWVSFISLLCVELTWICQLRSESNANIDKPPHISLFDPVSPQSLAAKSPLLQARLNAMAKGQPMPATATAPQAAVAVPVINVVMPNDLFGILRPGFPPAPGPQHLFPAIQQPIPASQPLIPHHLQPGIKLDIGTFCLSHGLSADILEKFRENAYTGTQAFRYIDVQELKDLGFKPGEIVDLKEAVLEWAVPKLPA
jgi:hypothetical protein